MGRLRVTYTPDKEKYKGELKNALEVLLSILQEAGEGEGIKKVYDFYKDLLMDVEEGDLSLDQLRKVGLYVVKFINILNTALQEGEESITLGVVTTGGEETLRELQKFTAQREESRPLKESEIPRGRTIDLLADLEEIRKASKSGLFKVSKDLLESQIHSSPGDALDLIQDEKIKRKIQRKAEKGEYIAGTLIGLSGGERYFKIFCLALAQTLNEQSKYYHTQEDNSGIPKELLSQYAGEGAIVEKIKDPSPLFKGGGTRPYPIVFLSWEDLAKKMSTTGEIAGGKDIKQVRDYVLGGTVKRKDKETGVLKEVYIHGLLDREFLIEGTKGIVGVPLMTKLLSLYPKDSPDKEVGIAVQLSPLFALKKIIGYTGIRSDTIQLLGGGKQRELTLNLFMYLAYYRNVPPQTGRKKGEFVKRKTDLLPEISRGIAYYTGRPGLLEKHFQEAVQKCIDAKILLPGTVKGAIKGYREEINPGGERLSIFVYNPDYLKGEEINLFSEVEDQ